MGLRTFLRIHNITTAVLIVGLAATFLSMPLFSQIDETGQSPQDDRPMQEEARKNASGEDPKKNKIFGFEIGMSGGYATGISVSNWQYRPYANLVLSHKYIKGTAGVYRCKNFLITDGEGSFENINFTQPKIGLSLYPHNVIELYGEYRYSTGDYSHYYRGHEGTAGFLLDFDVVTIDASCNKRLVEYEFKSVNWADKITLLYSDINIHGRATQLYTIDTNRTKYLDDTTATVNLSWNIIDTTSLDLTYYYLYSIFKYPRDSYYNHTGRAGVYSDVCKYISIHGGASLGLDAERYLIAGGDFGATFNILGYVTITASYLPSYFFAPVGGSALKRIIDSYVLYSYSYNSAGSTNPYLQPSQIGKSFWNHSVNFNITFRY